MVRLGGEELRVELVESPGRLSPALGGGGGGSQDLRPASVELQKTAIADTAPTLNQVCFAPPSPSRGVCMCSGPRPSPHGMQTL